VAIDQRPAAGTLHHIQFPGESAEYRAARNALLESEIALRRQLERVAAQRRTLPPGGVLVHDYVFERAAPDGRVEPVRLSELFTQDKNTLAIYSFMYGPERERPCPGCTHMLDSLDGAARHVTQRANFVVVAKSPVPRLLAFAKERGWRYLTLLSTAGNTYDRDYFGDSEGLSKAVRQQQHFKDGEEWDMPMLNVFRREKNTIHHFWGSELLYAPKEPGQDYRHNDLLDPVWTFFDNLPEGRGDFQPKLSYP
jgi:predicted dithiol-disulfide oxidoreductase (DUF899 family)